MYISLRGVKDLFVEVYHILIALRGDMDLFVEVQHFKVSLVLFST